MSCTIQQEQNRIQIYYINAVFIALSAALFHISYFIFKIGRAATMRFAEGRAFHFVEGFAVPLAKTRK
jgi:hypothetical protein